MIQINNLRLGILQDLRADLSLPKYKRQQSAESNDQENDGIGSPVTFINQRVWNANAAMALAPDRPWWHNITSWPCILDCVDKLFRRTRDKVRERNRMGEDQAMYLLLSSELNAILTETRVEAYDAQIAKYKTAGQTVVVAKLESERQVKLMENALLIEGYGKFVSEAKVVEVALKSKRGLALTFVRNFARPIPDDVLVKKNQLDQAGIFDEWVVMHYDPENKNNIPTAEEVRKLRDPILFGLLVGSDRLYYVADWVDEYCDLTLEQFVKLTDVQDVVGTVEEIKA